MQIHKLYKIEQSPLYNLRNKNRLCDLLETDLKTIKLLVCGENYWISTKVNSETGKKRTIYAPKPNIKKIQKRLQVLISRIEVPDYLFSGRKGLCYIDNAREHISAKYLTTIDISDFYNKCLKEFVFKSFRYTFNMSDDVAWLVADIVTYKGFIPTGSPASQLVAFWAYKQAFDRISNVAKKFDAIFTLFVDDMAFSSQEIIPSALILQVKKELEYVGHDFNNKKIKEFRKRDYKVVTGCVITPRNELRVKNKQRKDILDSWTKLNSSNENEEASIKSLLGKVQSAKQIEPQLFSQKYSYLSDKAKYLASSGS